MRFAALATLLAAAAALAAPAPAGRHAATGKHATLPLPPHVGAGSGYRPLILFNDTFFGRDFVKRDYAFEARGEARKAQKAQDAFGQAGGMLSAAGPAGAQDCPVECEVTWNTTREAEATAGARARRAARRRPRPLS